jgi:regulator of sigma E protease
MNLYGIGVFVLVFAILVFFHELGHFLFAKLFKMRVEEFALGIGPRLIRVWNDGQTDYTIRALPLGGFVRVAGMEIEDAAMPGTGAEKVNELPDEPRPAPDPNGFNSRPIYQRFFVILAGPVFSFLLGWLSLCLVGAVAGYPDQTTVGVNKVVAGGVADTAGIRSGDTLIALNGVKITKSGDALQTIRDNPGKTIELTIKNTAGQERAVTVVPKAETVEGKTMGRIGIETKPIILSSKKTDLATSFADGNKQVVHWFTTMANLFRTGAIKDSVGGPVAIFKETQQAADTGGALPMLLLGQLSLSLGLFNLFPIPVLDGGHLLLMGLEAVRRRKLTAMQTQRVFMAGFAVLMLLFAVVMVKDVRGMFMGG